MKLIKKIKANRPNRLNSILARTGLQKLVKRMAAGDFM